MTSLLMKTKIGYLQLCAGCAKYQIIGTLKKVIIETRLIKEMTRSACSFRFEMTISACKNFVTPLVRRVNGQKHALHLPFGV